MTGMRAHVTAFLLAGAIAAPATVALAQRGGGGDLEAPTPTGRELPPTNRLDILAVSLGLTKDQKNTAKTLMEEASKTAAPIRAKLTSTRAAIGAAIQAGGSQDTVTAAIKAHAAEITAMTTLEMTTLARVLDLLTPEQRTAVQANGIRAPFFLFRGAFLEQKWNTEPKQAGY
jgi:Spy/CpxP family protein refolding chaperone